MKLILTLLLSLSFISFAHSADSGTLFSGVSHDATGTHLKSGKGIQSCTFFIFQPDDLNAPIQLKFRFSDEALAENRDFFSGKWQTFGMDSTIGHSLPLEEGQLSHGTTYKDQVITKKVKGSKSYQYQVEISPDLSAVGKVTMLSHRGKVIASCLF